MPTSRYPWRVFWTLLGAAVCGSIAILPYVFEVFAKSATIGGMRWPGALLVVTQLLHLSLIFGVATGVGLLLARLVDLRLPVLERWLYGTNSHAPAGTFRWSLALGLVLGAITTAVFYLALLPRFPAFPSEASVPFLKRFATCLYGGINEELLMRLFLLSGLLWILQKISGRSARSSAAIFWIGNVIISLVFGAAYLPAVAALVPLTPALIGSIILLKAGAGLVFGQLAWSRGLEAAMLAHFVGDLVIHLGGPLLFPAG